MNGIDTGAAMLVANRVDTLGPVGGRGSAGTAQAGVSALVGGAPSVVPAQTVAQPQPSTQTELSAVALALDSIIRSGGDTTLAVIGSAPIWTNPDAQTPASAAVPALPGSATYATEGAAAAVTAVEEAEEAILTDLQAALADAGSTDSPAAGETAGTGAANPLAVPAQAGATAVLAAALAQTVEGSGLFYESHLAQWLLGLRSPDTLADEPQNRLVAGGGTRLSGWEVVSDDIEDVAWTGAATAERFATAGDTRADTAPGASQRFADAASGDFAGLPGALSSGATPGMPVHAAVIPLVRQQLDLLASGEFRWMGEAWAGAQLVWSFQQDRHDPRDPRHAGGSADPGELPWHTRLTLALPKLGTVDAELTLAGATLSVRVRASEPGAARLSGERDALRTRLEALGLMLAGLSIQSVGGDAAPGAADGAQAASAYARSAASPPDAPAGESDATPSINDFDWPQG